MNIKYIICRKDSAVSYRHLVSSRDGKHFQLSAHKTKTTTHKLSVTNIFRHQAILPTLQKTWMKNSRWSSCGKYPLTTLSIPSHSGAAAPDPIRRLVCSDAFTPLREEAMRRLARRAVRAARRDMIWSLDCWIADPKIRKPHPYLSRSRLST